MPRGIRRTALENLRNQGAKMLDSLQREISTKEKELAGLKAEADRWKRALTSKSASSPAKAPAKKVQRRRRKRINWNVALEGLPATFTANMVEEATGKPREQVYAAVSRWGKAKLIKRGKDGYQKVAAAPAKN